MSAPLVIHHFGSKSGLVEAVDAHFLARVEHHLADFAARDDLDEATSAIASMASEPDLFAYFGRALSDGGEAGARLFDKLFALSRAFLLQGIEQGLVRPVEDPDALATLLLVNDVGLVLMRAHVTRALGIDPYSPEGLARMMAADLDSKTTPLLRFPGKDTT